MSEDYAQGSAAEIERKVKQWHELKPAAILITMSSSYGPVVAIKEAWKKAYPHDIIPPFVTVDPRYIKRAGIAKESIEKPRYKETPQEYDENLYQKVLQKRDEIEKKLGKVLKKDPYSERILVFDETGPPAVDSTDEDSDRGSRKKVIMGPENAKTKSSYFFGRVGNNSLYYTGLLLSKPEKVVLNPIGLGSFWGLIGAAIATYMVKSEIRELKKAKENMSRRELLKGVALLPALLGGSGLYQGTVNASKPFIELQKMMENAIYLDSMRTKVYKK